MRWVWGDLPLLGCVPEHVVDAFAGGHIKKGTCFAGCQIGFRLFIWGRGVMREARIWGERYLLWARFWSRRGRWWRARRSPKRGGLCGRGWGGSSYRWPAAGTAACPRCLPPSHGNQSRSVWWKIEAFRVLVSYLAFRSPSLSRSSLLWEDSLSLFLVLSPDLKAASEACCSSTGCGQCTSAERRLGRELLLGSPWGGRRNWSLPLPATHTS